VDYSLLGKRIREERLRLNLTQEKLAEDINISTAYLGQIERGERSVTLEKLIPLANRLGVTVDFLLADYISPDSDMSLNHLAQLFQNKTDAEKEMAVNVIKLLFSYTDGKI
jgi:transcriptional regulator with XRE-family HTH domain